MLDFQLQQTPFRFGLAEGDSPHMVPFGVLTRCENYRWGKSGRLERRPGIRRIVTSGDSAVYRLVVRDDELCCIRGASGNLSFSSFWAGISQWRTLDDIPDQRLTWETVAQPNWGVSAADCAVIESGGTAGLMVLAWCEGPPNTEAFAVTYAVKDLASGALVTPPTRIESATSNGVRVLATGTTACIIFRRDAASPWDLRGYTVDATGNLSAGTTLTATVADIGGSGVSGWDAAVIAGEFVIAYNSVGGVITLTAFDTTLTQTKTGSSSEINGCHMCSLDGASGDVFLLYQQGVAVPSPIRFSVFDSNLNEVAGPTTIETPPANATTQSLAITAGVAASSACAMYDVSEPNAVVGANSPLRVMTYRVDNAGAVDTNTERGHWGVRMVTKPFVRSSRTFAFVTDIGQNYPLTEQVNIGNSHLVEIEYDGSTPPGSPNYRPFDYIGTVDVLIGGRWQDHAPLSKAGTYSGASYMTLPYQAEPAYDWAINMLQGVRLAKVTSPTGDMWRSVDYANKETYFTGCVLTTYDGSRIFDYSFPRGPYLHYQSATAAGGSMATGDYLYSFVFEYRSAANVLHRSAPSRGTTRSVTGPNGLTTTIVAGYQVTLKQSLATGFGVDMPQSTVLAPYRSTVNGSLYYRLAALPTSNFTTLNAMSPDSTLTDVRSDADFDGVAGVSLSTRPLLYTTGGVKEDYQPVSGITMFSHADRLWILAGDELTWWYSKTFQDDAGVAPGFHPDFRIVFQDKQVCGASMDDKAVFFSESGISYLLGSGPAANGANSDFASPIQIQTDFGCTTGRSVASTADGIMFRSSRGIELLTRGLEVVWIGKPVQGLLATYSEVTSAVIVPAMNEVRFTCNNSAGTAGVVLVYNTVEKQWSSFKYYDGTTQGCPIADAILWKNQYVFATVAGRTYVEDTSTGLDDGTYVDGVLETAWVSAAGPLAFHSVRNFQLQGVSQSAHDLTIECAFDSSDQYQQSRVFLAGSDVTSVGPLEECLISIGNRRKCMSIRFRVTDSAPTATAAGTGRGPYFETMGIEVGLLKGDGMSARKKG